MEVSPSSLADVQALPILERAVFILRDVLGWDAGDVAELLDMRLDSVNCALMRARGAVGGAALAHTRAPNSPQRPGTLS